MFVVVFFSLGFCEFFRGTGNGNFRAKSSVSYCLDRGVRLAFASRNLNVPWVRAPISRYSVVGTGHGRFAMVRWARYRFVLLWVYWFSLFLCVGSVVVDLSDVGLSDVGLSNCFGNGFPQRLGKF